MFSLRFAVVVLLTLGISGEQYDDTKPSANVEKGYPFGKLRLSEDGKKEELILVNSNEQTQLKQDQKQHVQPLPSPCVGTRPLTKLAYPGDKTKYIYCRDEFHYEIFSCPNNGEYNYQIGSCEAVIPVMDRCAEEKPCLNDGQCSILSNSTFKCTCRPDWTGDRCETPANSCVRKPCGPNAECRILSTSDYNQDYVCVCNANKGYGLNCDETVPNPCLKSTEQFFPYAYSQHAYLQCDGVIVYFQPCGPLLYWNQEEKICDRKRPPKLDLIALLKAYGATDEDLQSSTTTTAKTTTTTVAQRPLQEEQRERQNDEKTSFIPARIADRQQGLYSQNAQSHPRTKPQSNQQFGSQQWLNQISTSNTQNEQRFVPQSQSYQNYQVIPTTATTFTPVDTAAWQNQQQMQDQAEQSKVETIKVVPSTTTVPSWQTRPINQWNGYQIPQPQSWQHFRTVTTTTPATVNVASWQNQQQMQDQAEQSKVEAIEVVPSTTTVPSWQTRPINQWNGYQVPQSWQHFRTVTTTTPATVNVASWQNQQQMQDQTEQSKVEAIKVVPSTTAVPSWQTRPINQWNGYQIPQPQSWQNFLAGPTQQPLRPATTTVPTIAITPVSQSFNMQSWQNQYQQPTVETTSTPSNVAHIQGQSWPNKIKNEWNSNQVSPTIGFQPQSSYSMISSSQSRPNSHGIVTLQPILPITTTTTPQPAVLPDSQNLLNGNQFSQSVGITQQQGVATIQKTLDQTPSRTTDQQIPSQWGQSSGSANTRFQNLAPSVRSWPQNSMFENKLDQSKISEYGSWSSRA